MPKFHTSIPLNPQFGEYNEVSNQAFKAKVAEVVRFFVEGGYVVCFHWADFCDESAVPEKAWQWAASPECLGVIACDGYTLPSSLKAKLLAPEGYQGSLYKRFKDNQLEIYLDD